MKKVLALLPILCCCVFLSCKKSDGPKLDPPPTWVKVSAATGFYADGIQDMVIDRSGNIWAAFGYGVGKFNGTAWTTYKPFPVDPNSASSGNATYAIFEDRNGNIWAAIENNNMSYACKFDGVGWTKKSLTGGRIQGIIEFPNGNIWFGASGTGAFLFDGTNWTPTTCDGHCFSIQSAFKDKAGVVWIGNDRSEIVRYDGVSYVKEEIPYTYSYGGSVVDISQGSSGDIFASLTPGGLFRRKGNTWENVMPAGLDTGPAGASLQDSKGRIWFGSGNKGVFRVVGTDVTRYRLEGGSENVRKILEDRNGKLWLSNSYGLWWFTGS